MKHKIYTFVLCITLVLGLTACGGASSATLSTEQRLEALRGAYYVEVQELKTRGFSDAEIDALLASGMFEEIIGDSLVTAEEIKAQQNEIAEAERIAEEARLAEVKRLEEERLEQERKEAEVAEDTEQAAAAAKGKVVKTYNFTQSQHTPDPAIGDITVNEYSSGYREAVFSYAGKEYIYEVLYEDYVETYYICVEYQVPGVWMINFFFDRGVYCFSDGGMG